tara:strand:- start:3576 stop:5546 length:1971 start_codon:yes stop_codon:yes gene_type:complete
MLNLNINYTYVVLFIVFVCLLFNYYHLIKAKTNHFKKILIILRSIILISVLILLVNPNIERLNEENKTVDLIVDNSKSMAYKSQIINKNIEKILNWSSENFIDVNIYLFGDNYREISNINQIDFVDDYTSFGDLFSSHNTNNDIILLSDGINNYGSSEIDYEQFNSINIIGFGDSDYLDLDISIELADTLIQNEKIEISIIINKNIANQKISGKIFLSNNNNNNNKIIGSYNLNKLNSQEITLTLSADELENFNTIYIDNSYQEENYSNNSFNLILDDINELKKKLLIISGSISQNTNFIKNIIKNNLYDYDINHLYRINQSMWNKSIENINFNNYDLVVLDDFPLYEYDSKILNQNMKKYSNKILYFLGPNNFTSNYILNYCDCQYSKLNKNISNRKNEEVYYNNKYYYIQPNDVSFNIKCKDNENFLYNNGNSFIKIKDDMILFLIPNMNSFSSSLQNKELLFDDLLLSIIDNEIYNNNRLFEIFLNSNNITLANESRIDIKFYTTFSNQEIFLNIYKDNNLYNRFNEFNRIDNNHFVKDLLFDSSGDYLVQAELIDNDIKYSSNILNVSVNNIDYELMNKGLNMEFLSVVSNNTGGILYQYTDIDGFLENIEISNVNNVNYTKYDFKNYSYLLLFLVFLLSIEWYVRNKVGLV